MAAVDLISPLLVRLRDLAAAAVDPTPGRVCLYHGIQAAFDVCCDGGQLWSRLVTLEPRMGRSLANGQMCLTGWTATIEVGILRCAQGPGEDGSPPSPDTLDDETMQMTQDLSDIEQVLRCSGEQITLQRWDPLGPEGNCVGGAWTVLAAIGLCECSEPVDG